MISVHSNILMRKHILSLIALGPLAAAAQTPTVRLINTPDASSKPEFAMVAAVRQLAGGRLLVNDIQNRQLTILDPGLANAFVLADSTSGQLNSYGTRGRWTHSIRRRLDAVRRSGGIVDVRHRPQWQDRARRVGAAIAGRGQPRQQPPRHSGRRRSGTPRLSERRSSHHPARRQGRRWAAAS